MINKVKLVHNPSAGDEAHTKEALVEQIEAAGFECRYSSTKQEGWKEIDDDVEMIAVAGGDGTVRKVLKLLMKREPGEKGLPVGVLALGTANNIAKTFGVSPDTAKAVQSWKAESIKKVDVGLVKNIPEVDFFFEGLGFGVFPYLIKEMQKAGEVYASPQEELKGALKRLHHIVSSYVPRQCLLTVDDTDHSGKFFMVEVMNIRSIGPNMMLAPQADPGDGEFEIVLVPEAHKEKFAEFILNGLIDGDDTYHFHTLRGKKISISWDGTRLHADDKMLKLKKETVIEIEVRPGALAFLAG
ncbi:MAG TPA: diacylglycerol kinase family protein [Flavisolibacter sp.]|nr:diacylglycerol kinase family protein [Flavisolibacter sp.]